MKNADLLYQHALNRLASTGFDALSAQEGDLATLWHLEAGITNGGLAHYYSGRGGDLAFHAPEALGRIGATEKADIVRAANALFGVSGPSRDRSQRLAALKTLSAESRASLDTLEDRYLQDGEDVDELVERWLGQT